MIHEIYLEWIISCNAILEAGNGDSRIAISKNDMHENWTKSFYQNVTIMTEYIRDLHRLFAIIPPLKKWNDHQKLPNLIRGGVLEGFFIIRKCFGP